MRPDFSKPTLSRISTIGFLATILVLNLLIFPSLRALAGGDTGFSLELDNGITVAPTELKFLPEHNSEISLSFETSSFELETISEFDRNGYCESEITFGLSKERVEGELDLDFLPKSRSLEALAVTGEVEAGPETDFECDYSAEFPSTEANSDTTAELELAVTHEIAGQVTAEIAGIFSKTGKSLSLTPEESELKLSGLSAGPLELGTKLEFEGNSPAELGVDYSSHLEAEIEFIPELSGNITWDIQENSLKLEQEMEFSRGTLFLDGRFSPSRREFTPEEAGVNDLELGPVTLGLAKDLEAGNIDLELEAGGEVIGLALGIELSPADNELPYKLETLTGEISFTPTDSSELLVETDTDLTSFPVKVTFLSEYSF